MSRSGTDIAIEAMLSDQETLRAEVARLQADRDNWKAVSAGALKEQFRLAAENERLRDFERGALQQFEDMEGEKERLGLRAEKAEAENERLRALVLDATNGLDFHGHQVDASAIRSELRALEQARKE